MQPISTHYHTLSHIAAQFVPSSHIALCNALVPTSTNPNTLWHIETFGTTLQHPAPPYCTLPLLSCLDFFFCCNIHWHSTLQCAATCLDTLWRSTRRFPPSLLVFFLLWLAADLLLKAISTPSLKQLTYKKKRKTNFALIIWHRYTSARSGDSVLPLAGARTCEANQRDIEEEHWAQCARVRWCKEKHTLTERQSWTRRTTAESGW